MTALQSVKSQLGLSIAMFLASIFMTVSYFSEVASRDADTLSTIAFYVWLVSIFAWGIKIIYEVRK